jgi:4-hydroxy-tetrahydrodipicolinate reductase
MKIALLGYGKMGKAIEQVALLRGHEITLSIHSGNKGKLQAGELGKAEVAIEMSTPDSAVHHLLACFEAKIPVVCGTTGWLQRMDEVRQACLSSHQAFLYSSNFSIGVHIFFRLNKLLAELMDGQGQYRANIGETHHIHKKDAPSGTALLLAQDILDRVKRLRGWSSQTGDDPSVLPVISHRLDEVPGTHDVSWTSSADSIQITHTAFNREGFATGAVVAAEWIRGKTGIFGISDVLGFS